MDRFEAVKSVFSASPERATVERGAAAINGAVAPPEAVASERATKLPGPSFDDDALALSPREGTRASDDATGRTLAIFYPTWLVSAAEADSDEAAYERITGLITRLTEGGLSTDAVDAMFDRFAVDTLRDGVPTMLLACAALLTDASSRGISLQIAMAARGGPAYAQAENETLTRVAAAYAVNEQEFARLERQLDR